jgi:hypothetical protein
MQTVDASMHRSVNSFLDIQNREMKGTFAVAYLLTASPKMRR